MNKNVFADSELEDIQVPSICSVIKWLSCSSKRWKLKQYDIRTFEDQVPVHKRRRIIEYN